MRRVKGQVEEIALRLDTHRTRLLEDVEKLERLYDATLEWFHTLAEHIAAGEAVLQRVDTVEIPAAVKAAENPEDPLAPQRLRDMRAARDELDRRLHDLRLTRQVAMQALPSIRLIQENDKALAAKIHSVLANTVPLWRTQLAQALAIQRMREAGRAVKEATDLTNTLLTANAETLRRGNQEARTELERGVFDIEAIKRANATLVATIEDSSRIAEEGRQRRAEATAELAKAEEEISPGADCRPRPRAGAVTGRITPPHARHRPGILRLPARSSARRPRAAARRGMPPTARAAGIGHVASAAAGQPGGRRERMRTRSGDST